MNKTLYKNELIRIEIPYEPVKVKITPSKKMDIGSGRGQQITSTIFGGEVGIILDGRNRPIEIPDNQSIRLDLLKKWSSSMNEYPTV